MEGSVALASLSTSAVAWPSATPGFRLKESVTEGSWPEWLTVSGPMPGVILTSESSGTSWPFAERT